MSMHTVSAARPVDLLVHSAGAGLPPGGYLGNPLEASDALGAVTMDALAALRDSDGPNLVIQGSSTLYPQLLAHGLLDVLAEKA